MKKKFNSTQEVRDELKREGYKLVFITEQWFGGFKHDLLGAIDAVGYAPHKGWIGVNGCTENKAKKHMTDAMNNILLNTEWLDFGFKFYVYVYPEKAQRDEGDTEPRKVPFEMFPKWEDKR